MRDEMYSLTYTEMIYSSTALLLSTVSTVSATVCPVEWSYFDGLCWRFDQSPRSFEEAEKECRSQSGELVSSKGESHNYWIDIMTTPYVSLQYKPDCFEREMAPAWIAPRLATHIKLSSVQECLAICASSNSLLEWECTRVVYDTFSQGCLLLGSSPGEGDKMGVDPSFEAYNNLCWLEETTKNEVSFPDGEEEEDSTPTIENVEELKKKLVSMKQIDNLPSIDDLPSTVIVSTEPAFRPVVSPSSKDLRKCFRRVPQVTIPGRADDIYQNVTSTECLQKCIECEDCLGDDQPCLSVVYYDHVSECVLLRVKENEGVTRKTPVEETSSLYWRDTRCEEDEKCTPHMDLVILLDGSDSIGKEDFKKGIRVVQKLMDSIRQLRSDVRVKILQIGEGIKEEIPLSALTQSTVMEVEKIEMIGGRSLLGATVSHVIKNTPSDNAQFILISDLFVEDNPKLIEIELNKGIRTMITLSLTETYDGNIGERLTMGDSAKRRRDHHQSDIPMRNKRNKRGKRETVTLESRRVWIGLRRTEEGELQWTDHSTVSDLSRLSDRPTDTEKCVSSEMEWKYTSCEMELPFVCTFTPLERLESLIQRSFTITSLHMPQ